MVGKPKGNSDASIKTKQEQVFDAGETVVDNINEAKIKQSVKKQYKVKKEIDPKSVVTVKNGFQGKLVYCSKRTGEKFEWESFGDEQDMEFQELKNARNASKAFFVNNWFLIDDREIVDSLGLQQYYSNALSYDSFDGLFAKTPAQIESAVNGLSSGQKRSVAYRARVLIADGTIDSIKIINALEKSLSIELIER